MYAYIKGTLEETGEDYIVVEAGGIGYQIFTTGQTFQYLPSMGEEVKVYTYLHVREDAMILFGFLTKDDLFVFRTPAWSERDWTEGRTCGTLCHDDR